jgi:Helix-turn-helix domain
VPFTITQEVRTMPKQVTRTRESKYLTVKQAAARFGISPTVLYQHREIPHIRIASSIRFIEKDLVRFFKSQSMILK